MIKKIKDIFKNLKLTFYKKKKLKIGLYGPPNSGKTTLANRICSDLLSIEYKLGTVSNIAHETRKIGLKEELTLKINNKTLKFDLIDTPGIATRIDYEKFMKLGMSEKESKQRAKEATKGVIESIKWLDNMDIVVVVLDSTKNPYDQVNLTIIGNLEARKIKTLIVANKVDLKSSKLEKIQEAFNKYKVIGISAKFSRNMDEFYELLLKTSRGI
ncbi:MAG: GTP-binding protein [Candidatus Woesearchaeota archaeon]|nr:MAG: GTP-binding protein [Candidatus Woesearchaeota archaeon]